jgi:hypothetical protein
MNPTTWMCQDLDPLLLYKLLGSLSNSDHEGIEKQGNKPDTKGFKIRYAL